MGIPRERQVFVGLGIVAVVGLMIDRVVLAPSGAAASEQPAAEASAAGPVAAIAGAATAKLQSGIRVALHRAFEEHAKEQMPDLQFGPDADWLIAPVAQAIPGEPARATTTTAPPAAGVLPGLSVHPSVSLVMPTAAGGMAVIDGKSLRVGERHPDGYTLVAVGIRSVTIGFEGATAEIRLPSPGGER